MIGTNFDGQKKIAIYNKNAAKLIVGKSYCWHPFSRYLSMLWVWHIGKGKWPAQYWIEHFFTNYYGLQLITEGDMKVSCNGKTFLVTAGNAILVPPGGACRLETGPSNYCVKKYIAVRGSLANSLCHFLNLNEPAVINNLDTKQFNDLFERIYTLHLNEDPATISEISGSAYLLLMLLGEKKENSLLPEGLTKCRAFIESNVSQKIFISDMCKVAGCSLTTLKLWFKKYLNTSPGEFHRSVRINLAKILLKDPVLRINEVAALCGYQDQLYFSKDFKARTGHSPREYRSREYTDGQGHAE